LSQFNKSKSLKKELGLFDVYAIATGTTLSAGFFLLPGLAAQEAGPALIIAYLIAAIPLIPAMFSIVELATAMPRAGGVYYFLDRSLGPLSGTIGGIGTWLSLVLKVTFALIGMGAYIKLFIPELSIVPVAIFLAIALGILNLYGAKKTGMFQILLVIGLLILLISFIVGGIPQINYSHFKGFFDAGTSNILATAGLVYISYVGVTKVASLSEEVKNPEKNLPLGVFLALGTAILIYALGTSIIVGVVPLNILKGNLTPVATAAKIIFGKIGAVLLSIAALLAFISVANAGTMSASRYPLAMSRDHIIPDKFKKLNSKGTPSTAIGITVGTIVTLLILLDPTKIAKLASAFQLLMFALVCFAVIIMRESKIESYDPGYHSPFYPWTQIIGIITPIWLIIEMGFLPIAFSLGLIIISIIWYWYYAKDKVVRNGAIYHIFERLGRQRYEALDTELRGILKEKGLRKKDPFDQVVTRAKIFELDKEMNFEDVLDKVSPYLSSIIQMSSQEIKSQFLEGTRIGATPVTHGVALPHFRLDKVPQIEMVLVRSKPGVHITLVNPLTQEEEQEEIVFAMFFLVSPQDDPAQHLRMLAQIAGRVDDENFMHEWDNAKNELELKEALLHDDRFISITLNKKEKNAMWIGKRLKELHLPEGCLIALLTRDNLTIIPQGNTLLQKGDRITIIGEPKVMNKIKKMLN